MALVVHGVTVAVDEVVAVDIIDIAVVVVVDSVAGDFVGVDPHVVVQIGVVIVDTRIDYGDHSGPAAVRDIPGKRGIDISVCRAAGLAEIFQRPHFAEPGVGRVGLGNGNTEVRFGVGHHRIVAIGGQGLFHVYFSREANFVEPWNLSELSADAGSVENTDIGLRTTRVGVCVKP